MVSRGQGAETQPGLESGRISRVASAGASAPRPGLRLVFPELRVGPLAPTENQAVVLGREEAGPGRLAGDDVSRRHAELRFAGGRLFIRDLGSRNGIFVNGRRQEQTVLRRHDVVRVGGWIGIVVVDPGDPGDEPGLPGNFQHELHLGPTARQIVRPARELAPTGISLVLEGETGTGKERVARAVHRWSGRRGPFVAINCAAIPESIAEAELFGYREGAFTGAQRPSPGHVRAAHGGTLFLDEITDMPLALQAKLLRVLEEREVVPVGESTPIAVDVRFLAATQIPLGAAVAERRFRADLQARLDGFTLQLPPLRERPDDIPSLFLHLSRKHGLSAGTALSPRLIEALCGYGWPLNVRELDFLAQRLVAEHGREPLLRRSHLPARFTDPSDRGVPADAGAHAASQLDRLMAALMSADGNLARAAEQVGVSRQKAYRLLGGAMSPSLEAARNRARRD
jgi:transcriptional regulator of acetoin/glycerol metabolism